MNWRRLLNIYEGTRGKYSNDHQLSTASEQKYLTVEGISPGNPVGCKRRSLTDEIKVKGVIVRRLDLPKLS